MSDPKISIITVSRNSEKTLERTLRSVADQKGLPTGSVDHWLIDGASTDGTLKIAAQFGHLKVVSEPDLGISDAFNKGIRLSRGQWLLFLNSDDELFDSTVLVDVLAALRDDLDFLYGRIETVEADPQNGLPIHKTLGRDEAWKHLAQRMTLPHPATFMNRRYVEKYGQFNTEYKIAMDYELILRGYRRSSFAFLPRTINLFSKMGVSSAGSGWRQAKECYRAKTKHRVGSFFSRLFWLVYQGTRFSLEARLAQLPWMNQVTRRIADAVHRGY